MRTTHLKKTAAMSGAMLIALMGATAPADAQAPNPGKGAHDNTDKVEKNAHGTNHAKSHHAKTDDAKTAHAKTSQGKKTDHSSQSQAASSHGSSSHGNGSTHGNAGTQGGKGGDPAGNNGTVKIAPLGDFDGIPNNTPHVGCDFLVEWYGFDQGADIISTVTFAMQAPTSDVVLGGYTPTQVFVGEDPASGAGTDSGLDARQEYHLTFDGAPHPKQGYHVKLTINTPHSKGADVKHKVFWVQGCETGGETGGTGGETGGTGGNTGGTGGETGGTGGNTGGTGGNTGGSTPEVAGEQGHQSQVHQPQSQPEVLGEQATKTKGQPAPAVVPTVVDSGLAAVTTAVNAATDEWPLALGALGLGLLGAGALTRRARR